MLHFSQTSITGVIHIIPHVHEDSRGFFMETYSQRDYAQN